MASPFTRPRYVHAPPPVGLGCSGGGRCRSGRGLLVVFNVFVGPGDVRPGLVALGVLVADKQLEPDSGGAERQLVHR